MTASDGFSGAQMREVAYLALQQAVLRDEIRSDAELPLDDRDVMRAIARLRGNRDGIIGFGGVSAPGAKQGQPHIGGLPVSHQEPHITN